MDIVPSVQCLARGKHRLTGVACYCTLPDMGTKWPDNRKSSVWFSVTTGHAVMLSTWQLVYRLKATCRAIGNTKGLGYTERPWIFFE